MIQTFDCDKEGFNVVMESQGWQIAILHSGEGMYRGPLNGLGKHMTSDEVFILVKGSGTLYTADDGVLNVIPMEIGKVYNVPLGEWHGLRLSEDATAIVAENTNMDPAGNLNAKLTEILK